MTETLPHRHLTTLTLDVDFAGVVPIGATPTGRRGIAPVTGGRFEGERLSGTVLPGGQDWFVARPDASMAIDVRLTLKTDDAALIYLAYQGHMRASAEVMARFRNGEALAPEEYALHTVARFESGEVRYAWVNDMLTVSTGEQLPTGVRYTIFEIGR